MSTSAFVGEIALFPYTFPPQGWAFCRGQLMPISQNTALFSLLGTYYGGDGRSTFALPNLQSSSALAWGQGPGLSDRFLGESGGTATVTLLQSEMPRHSHTLLSSQAPATTANPATAVPGTSELPIYHATASGSTPLGATGGSLPHNNLQPYLTLSYCIALQGIFPPRG